MQCCVRIHGEGKALLREPPKASFAALVPTIAVAAAAASGGNDGFLAEALANLLGWILPFARWLAEQAGQRALFDRAQDWAFGPGLPWVGGVAAFVIATAIGRAPIADRPLVERLWPSPPSVLDMRLVRPEADIADPQSRKTAFTGREEELRAVMRFAGEAGGKGACFLMLTGGEGVGKTRLALEAALKLKTLGWDVGFLSSATDLRLARTTHFRRKTFILVDDAGRRGALWPVVVALLGHKARLRLLLIEQYAPAIPDDLDAPSHALAKSADAGELRLGPVDAATLKSIAPALDDGAIAAADGRPLFALLGGDPGPEIARRAPRRESLAGDDAGRRTLAFAALAGPAPRKGAQGMPDPGDVDRLRRIFEGEDPDVLAAILPVLKPDRLANEVLLRFLAVATVDIEEPLVTGALRTNPAAFEHRLGSLWSEPGERPPAHRAARQRLTDAFLLLAPERSAAIVQEAHRLADSIQMAYFDQICEADLSPPEEALRALETVSERFPFLEGTLLALAKGIYFVFTRFGSVGRFEELERLGERLASLAADPRFSSDDVLRVLQAASAHDAMLFYRKAGRFDDLERWGVQLIILVSDSRFCENVTLRLAEARSADGAMLTYGMAGRFDDLERWGARLAALAADPRFSADTDIRATVAEGAFNAMSAYGRAGRFNDLERWGARLAALAADPRFAGDAAIRLQEATGAVNAMACCGKAGRFDDLESWGARLAALAADPRFAGDDAMRLREAHSSSNAMLAYCKVGRSNDLERWGARLAALAADPRFAGDAAIRCAEAIGAHNAMLHYGDAKRFDDLERWGARLAALAADTRFASDAEIRRVEARGAFNAMLDYGEAGRFDDVRRWRQRLARAARDFPGDPEIQSVANKHGLTYAAQATEGWPYGAPKHLAATAG